MARRKREINGTEALVKLCAIGGFCIFMAVTFPPFRQALKPLLILPFFVVSGIAVVIGLAFAIKLLIRINRNGPPFEAPPVGPVSIHHVTGTTFAAPKSSVTTVVEPPMGHRLREIDWFQFEKLVAAAYSAKGYRVERRGGAHPDGGVDLIALKDGITTVIQCKHWQNRLVKPDKIRELIGAKTIEKANRAILVALEGFTEAAIQVANEQEVQLIDEKGLVDLLEDLRFTPHWPDITEALESRRKTCPKCESTLIERVAKRGNNTGGTFWGCSTYPRCRFVLPSR